MGFDAIWISPVVDNSDGGYHGYWARDWTKLNSHFGSENDLKALVSACHQRGIWVMVDVVANHVAPVGTDYHTINPFNKAEHYHDYCEIRDEDFKNNQWRVENCRLAKLPDLKQENNYVSGYLYQWINSLVSKYGLDGIRIDTVPEVPKWFWNNYRQYAKVFSLGEVFDDRLDYLRGYIPHVDSVLNYGLFKTIHNVFKGGSFTSLVQKIEDEFKTFGNEVDYMGLFADNHDNARFLNGNGCWDCLMGAITFTMFFKGIPIIYYGDEQGYGGGNDPENREELWTHLNKNSAIYQMIARFNAIRKRYRVWDQQYHDKWHTEHMLAFMRGGDVLVILNNANGEVDISNMSQADGTKFCNVLQSSDCLTVKNKKLHVSMQANKSKVYVKS